MPKRKRAPSLLEEILEHVTPKITKWGIVYGDPVPGTTYVCTCDGRPAWTPDREEAQAMCPPGAKVVDIEAWLAQFKAQQAAAGTSPDPNRPTPKVTVTPLPGSARRRRARP